MNWARCLRRPTGRRLQPDLVRAASYFFEVVFVAPANPRYRNMMERE
jgi:hypothetical protein